MIYLSLQDLTLLVTLFAKTSQLTFDVICVNCSSLELEIIRKPTDAAIDRTQSAIDPKISKTY